MYDEIELLDMMFGKMDEYAQEYEKLPNTLVISKNYLNILSGKLEDCVYTSIEHNTTKVFGMELITTIKENIMEVY